MKYSSFIDQERSVYANLQVGRYDLAILETSRISQPIVRSTFYTAIMRMIDYTGSDKLPKALDLRKRLKVSPLALDDIPIEFRTRAYEEYFLVADSGKGTPGFFEQNLGDPFFNMLKGRIQDGSLEFVEHAKLQFPEFELPYLWHIVDIQDREYILQREVCEHAMGKWPKSHLIKFHYARMELKHGQFEKAIPLLDDIIAENPLALHAVFAKNFACQHIRLPLIMRLQVLSEKVKNSKRSAEAVIAITDALDSR